MKTYIHYGDTIELTPMQIADMIVFARSIGLKDETPRGLLIQLLTLRGTESIQHAERYAALLRTL